MSSLRFVDASHSREQIHRLYKAYSDELARYSSQLTEEPMTEDLIDELYFYDSLLDKYFIEIDGQVVGFIILQYVDERYNVKSHLWYIVEFYIVPEYRRKGYGELAFKFFLEFYKRDFFYYVLKRNEPAKQFWGNMTKKFGLKEVYRPDVTRDDDEEIETHSFAL